MVNVLNLLDFCIKFLLKLNFLVLKIDFVLFLYVLDNKEILFFDTFDLGYIWNFYNNLCWFFAESFNFFVFDVNLVLELFKFLGLLLLAELYLLFFLLF